MGPVGQYAIAETPTSITSAKKVYVISLFFVIQEYSFSFDISVMAPFHENLIFLFCVIS